MSTQKFDTFEEAINAVPETWKVYPVWDDEDEDAYHWEASEDSSKAAFAPADVPEDFDWDDIAAYIGYKLELVADDYDYREELRTPDLPSHWCCPWECVHGWSWPSKADISAFCAENAEELEQVCLEDKRHAAEEAFNALDEYSDLDDRRDTWNEWNRRLYESDRDRMFAAMVIFGKDFFQDDEHWETQDRYIELSNKGSAKELLDFFWETVQHLKPEFVRWGKEQGIEDLIESVRLRGPRPKVFLP